MVAPTTANLDWIRPIHLFTGLDDEDLAWVLARCQEFVYQDGEFVFRQGDPPNGLFFIREGFVEVLQGEERLAVLERRDYFGEEALILGGKARVASVRALGRTRLYHLSLEDFGDLLKRFPQVAGFLRMVARSRRRARRQRPPWLTPNEAIYLFIGKHPSRFFVETLPLALLLAAVVALTGSLWLANFWPRGNLLLGGLFLASLLADLGWILWKYIDWRNDEYLVTNQRVVWIERVALIYESRTEAPLRTILSINVTSDLEGRSLGYSHVVIRTWFGNFTLRYVGSAWQIEALIKEFWLRTQERVRHTERQMMVQMLKERFGLVPPQPPPAKEHPAVASQPSWGARMARALWRLLRWIFSERIEEGEVITYRKHWIVLFRRIWWQTLLLALLALVTLLPLVAPDAAGPLPRGAGWRSVLLALQGMLLLWIAYRFLDWANDIYQLTPTQVIDIERTPWGSESKQSAPLESIQSLDHARKGLLGILLNYGDVHIRAGTATLVFRGVHKPDQVLQEIYHRMEARRLQKAEAEAQRERERLVEWLAAYHHTILKPEDAPRLRQGEEEEPDLPPPSSPPPSHRP